MGELMNLQTESFYAVLGRGRVKCGPFLCCIRLFWNVFRDALDMFRSVSVD